jgi:hypothetical protein
MEQTRIVKMAYAIALTPFLAFKFYALAFRFTFFALFFIRYTKTTGAYTD